MQCKCNNGVAAKERFPMLIEISKRLLKDITYAKSLFKATKEIDDAPCIEMSHVKPWPWIYSFLQCFLIGDGAAVFCTYFFYQFEKIKSAQLDCFIALVTVLFYGTVSCPFSMMMQCLQNAMQQRSVHAVIFKRRAPSSFFFLFEASRGCCFMKLSRKIHA